MQLVFLTSLPGGIYFYLPRLKLHMNLDILLAFKIIQGMYSNCFETQSHSQAHLQFLITLFMVCFALRVQIRSFPNKWLEQNLKKHWVKNSVWSLSLSCLLIMQKSARKQTNTLSAMVSTDRFVITCNITVCCLQISFFILQSLQEGDSL